MGTRTSWRRNQSDSPFQAQHCWVSGFPTLPVPLLWAFCPLAAALPCRQYPLVSSLITASAAAAKCCSYCVEMLFNSSPWLELRKKQLQRKRIVLLHAYFPGSKHQLLILFKPMQSYFSAFTPDFSCSVLIKAIPLFLQI